MKTFMKMAKARWITVGAALVAVGLAGVPAFATTSTATTTFTVTATVNATCTISATSLAFGTYASAAATAQSTISVTCSNTTAYNVGLNQGTTTGATVTSRQMTGPSGATLNYALYQNSGLTTNWGNTAGTDTVSGTGNGAAQTLTVYGQIAGGQFPAAGSYTDTVTATVYY